MMISKHNKQTKPGNRNQIISSVFTPMLKPIKEETVDEINEALESPSPPPKRRRSISTIFERRESTVTQTPPENVTPNTSDGNAEESAANSNHHLSWSLEQLQSEKEQWMKEVKKWRHRYHDLKDTYEKQLQTPRRVSMSFASLTDKDVESPNAKRTHRMEAQRTLHQSVKKTKRAKDDRERKSQEPTNNIVDKIEPME